MEGYHGVDVSWMARSKNRDIPLLPPTTHKKRSEESAHRTSPLTRREHADHHRTSLPLQPPASPTPAPAPVQTKKTPVDEHHADPRTHTPDSTPSRIPFKRPGTLSRSVSEKSVFSMSPDGSGKSISRKTSWISNLRSSFGSSPQPQQTHGKASGSGANGNVHRNFTDPTAEKAAAWANLTAQQRGSPSAVSMEGSPLAAKTTSNEHAASSFPQQPRPNLSFFSNALRRLSSSSQLPGSAKAVPNGGLCPRRVLNVDPNRERCSVPELEPNRLRKVSFSVDVEIAGGGGPAGGRRRDRDRERRSREMGEGVVLVDMQPAPGERDDTGQTYEAGGAARGDDVASEAFPDGVGRDWGRRDIRRRSEEQKKDRAEKRRKKAEENGSLPMEISRDTAGSIVIPSAPSSGPVTPRPPQDRPTTDPLRIYRRCCQLRETPILKRITEQLALPSTCPVDSPGIVSCLDLTGSRLQPQDVVALSDWLAIVPVKRLLFENSDLSDEGLRVVLAGLLAAKPPEEQRSSPRKQTTPKTPQMPLGSDEEEQRGTPRKQTTPKTPQLPLGSDEDLRKERLGMVEKLSLRNNPRLTATGWKHVSLFIYMCRSLKALDVSMNAFPNTRVRSPGSRSEMGPHVLDMSEIFSRAVSERLAGGHLEEVMMAECGLSAYTIRKLVDAVMRSGISRLGLAGNSIDDEGLKAVVSYLRSGVCQGLDLAGNDLRGRLGTLVGGLTQEVPLWALSLADCNLDVDSITQLFPSLVTLQNLRFVDLSQNKDLFNSTPDAVSVLREYIPQMQILKRIHLSDVALETRQAIGLAEVLPEAPHLAHLNILGNAALARLASATTEADQEEACALYAALMSAARTSDSLICIDIDIPAPENSEIVKALAKQVIAYCLRNMARFAADEARDRVVAVSNAQDIGTGSTHAVIGSPPLKDIDVPEVLMHLVGQVEDHVSKLGEDDTAPDDDYIVGGTGVVKALSYCLREKAADLRRESQPSSGVNTPTRGVIERESRAKAKKLSTDLLGSARKIRMRLQPALLREAKKGDEMAYRRLMFLDNTLQHTIDRFETEFPEMRMPIQSPQVALGGASPSSTPSTSPKLSRTSSETADVNALPSTTKDFGPVAASTAVDESDDDEPTARSSLSSHASDVNLASRIMGIEEGHMHRIGQQVRRDILCAPSFGPAAVSGVATTSPRIEADSAAAVAVVDPPALALLGPDSQSLADAMADIRTKFDRIDDGELRRLTTEDGLEEVFKRVGANAEELKELRVAGEMGGEGMVEENLEWRAFREAQETAIKNTALGEKKVGE